MRTAILLLMSVCAFAQHQQTTLTSTNKASVTASPGGSVIATIGDPQPFVLNVQ